MSLFWHIDSADIRAPSLYIPTSTLATQTKVSEDIEPENVVISADGSKAWVALQVGSWFLLNVSYSEAPLRPTTRLK